MTFDDSYRIGRCNHCSSRPSYAWPAVTGLRLDDVRCPRCHHWLDRTSRETHRMRSLTPDEIQAVLGYAVAHAETQLEEARVMLAAWTTEPVTDDTSRWRRQFNMDSYGKTVKAGEERVRRLRRGAASLAATV